jgi:hypothetical protein
MREDALRSSLGRSREAEREEEREEEPQRLIDPPAT